jgi:hypothetical protein
MELPCQSISKGVQSIKMAKSIPYHCIKTRGYITHGKTEPNTEHTAIIPGNARRKKADSRKNAACQYNQYAVVYAENVAKGLHSKRRRNRNKEPCRRITKNRRKSPADITAR